MRYAILVLVLLCLSVPALAQSQGSYGWKWPLTLSHDDAGAYRVVIEDSVYERMRHPQALDLQVRNAQDLAVPTTILGPEEPLATGPQEINLPLFELPPDFQRASSWHISRENDSMGQIRRSESSYHYESAGPSAGVLLDASRVREPIVAITLDWAQDTGPLDITVIVEASNDLESWRTVVESAQLVDLRSDEGRVLRNRIPLGQRARYLRVRPHDLQKSAHFVSGTAHLHPARQPVEWSWRKLEGESVTDAEGAIIEYELDGRFPVERADLILERNSVAEWTLESRDQPEGPWHRRAGPWVGFKVEGEIGRQSEPQELPTPTRDRYWRLVSKTPTRDMPVLALGYRPEVVVFLAQGDAPFHVVAGSTSAARTVTPLTRLVDSLRQELGEDWNPISAYPGEEEELDGEEAVTPEPEEEDSVWILWLVLVLGTLLVAGLAIGMLFFADKDADAESPSDEDSGKPADDDSERVSKEPSDEIGMGPEREA